MSNFLFIHTSTDLFFSNIYSLTSIQWEDSLIRGTGPTSQPLLESRVFFSRVRGYPSCVMSVIKYAPEKEAAKLERQRIEDQRGEEVFFLPSRDWRGSSYRDLILVRTCPLTWRNFGGLASLLYPAGYIYCVTGKERGPGRF